MLQKIPPDYYDYDYFETKKKGPAYVGYDPSGIFTAVIKVIQPIFKATSVLDIGCAYGWMQKLYPVPLAIGIDFSPYAIQKRVTNRYVCASASHLPFKENTFDLIITTETLEHLTDEQVAHTLREITRVGKKWLYMTSQRPIDNEQDKSHIRCRTFDEWVELGEAIGWRFDLAIVNYIKRSKIAQTFNWDIYVFRVKS